VESKAEYQLDITEADVWADFRVAMQADVEEYDPAWKSAQELGKALNMPYKTAYGHARDAIERGDMESQWQYRGAGSSRRRVRVYRVVKHDSK